MPFYSKLRISNSDSLVDKQQKQRIAGRLLALRQALKDQIFAHRPEATSQFDRDDHKWLRIATWNIREFDSKKYGGREQESFYYIAEILSHFDLVAVQEVRGDLKALDRVMRILGPYDWAYISSDVTEGSSGNRERMVFIYNKKKVWFNNIAGEITLQKSNRIVYPHDAHLRDTKGLKLVLPSGEQLESPENIPIRTWRGQTKLDGDLTVDLPEGTHVQLPKGSKLYFPDGFDVQVGATNGSIDLDASETPQFAKEIMIDLPANGLAGNNLQFARTPSVVSFQSGWLKLMLCTVHIYYGQGKKGMARRNEEIKKLTKFLSKRAQSEKDSDANNFFIVLGDFNIVGKNHVTWDSLHSSGFKVPQALADIPLGSNVARDKNYDQIAFWETEESNPDANTFLDTGNAGIFDFYKHVFRLGDDDPDQEDENLYAPLVPGNTTYKDWRTYQISDHLPMWIELRIDFGDDYLQKIQIS